MGKKRDQVRRRYPKAVCVPWWSGADAYQIHKDAYPLQEAELGRGASPGLAWADAARRLHSLTEEKEEGIT